MVIPKYSKGNILNEDVIGLSQNKTEGELFLMTFKKATKWMSVLSLSLILAACDQEAQQEMQDETETTEETDTEEAASGDFDTSQSLNASTREDGSGTRSAFVEIVGLEDEDGNDMIDQSLTIQDGTNSVITGVQEDPYAMGYISVGSLNDDVKALQVEGVEPSQENIQSGDYAIARQFYVAWGSELSEAAQDFMDFVLSAEGQQVVADNGEVPVESDAPAFEGGDVSGQVQINGSTSVTPVIELLTEAYNEINPDVTFDIASTGSGAGVQSAIDDTADLGMSSRDLTEEELEQVEDAQAIAIDGIAVIVNPENPMEDISLDQLQSIYLGEVSTWDEVQ